MNGADLLFPATDTHGPDVAGGGNVFMGGFYLPRVSFVSTGPLELVAIGERTIIDGKCNVMFQRISDQLQRGKLCFQNRDSGAMKKRI